jgi:hypothetical protein
VIKSLCVSARPPDLDIADFPCVAYSKMDWDQARRSVANRTGHFVPLLSDANARAKAVAIAARARQAKLDPVSRSGGRVMPDFGGVP